MSKSQLPKRKSPLARRLVGAAFAATLLSGALVTGAVLVTRNGPTSVSLRLMDNDDHSRSVMPDGLCCWVFNIPLTLDYAGAASGMSVT